jgi:nucleotide-binding universal stress UspA family protein
MRAVQVSGAVLAGMTEVLPTAEELGEPGVERLQRWVEADLPALERMPTINYAVAFGIPGVEIARFAEHERADLLVLGRKPRSRMARLLLGDTADAVVRRSRCPPFVPPTAPCRVGAGGDRRLRLGWRCDAADDFARPGRGGLRVLTVGRLLGQDALDMLPRGAHHIHSSQCGTPSAMTSRCGGATADQSRRPVDERPPDVLVLGCIAGTRRDHRAGSTARRGPTAPCAV